MLNGIESYLEELNINGLSKIQYLPTAWVDRSAYRNVVNSGNISTVDVPIITGSWLTAPVLPFSRRWDERPGRTNGLKFYDQSISGRTPHLKPAVTGELSEMKEYQFLIRITDRNKQDWILGTLDTPFSFDYRASTSGTAGYELSFTAETSEPAHGLIL